MSQRRGLCIGAGYFAQFHLDAWRRLEEAEIVAVCDLDAEKAETAAKKHGVDRWFTDVEKALTTCDIDFVDIITPPDTHLPLVELAARHGCHVICQKPLAPDFATARQIVELVESYPIRFMVHENFRFQPWHREIRRLLDAKVLGDRLHTLTFRSRFGDGWGSDAYLARQPYFREMPRFLVQETGVHFIDTFRYLAGEIEEVSAILRRLNPGIRGEDAGLLTFRFRDGDVGLWDANRYNEGLAENPRYTFGEFLIEGNGGTLRLYADGRMTIQPLGAAERDHPYEHSHEGFAGDCVLATQRHFLHGLAEDSPFETEGEDYLRTLSTVEAAYQSAMENRPVKIPSAEATNPPEVRKHVVDLSLTIDDDLPGAEITVAKTLAQDGWNATTLRLYSHCGTHMDAPRHFLEAGATIDQQVLNMCQGPARVLDLTPIMPRELIGVEHLSRWEAVIRPGDRLLLRTDWYLRLGSDEYRNGLPRISPELARWLVERGVALLGVEPPSVADVNNIDELTEVHRILLSAGIVIVEGLAHLDALRQDVVEFIALPLKIAGGDGCPVRAIAIEHS